MKGSGPAERDGFADSLAGILDARKPLVSAKLSEISDLNRTEAVRLRGQWPAIAVERRRDLVARLAELAEDNFEFNFQQVFLIAVKDPDAVVRTAAASGLVLSEEGSVVDPLVRMLSQDESEPVRIAAALSLGKFVLQGELGQISAAQTSKARESLLAVIKDRSLSAELRRRALESLSPWSSPQVTELIANAYRSTEPAFKTSAVYAMGMNCDARWLPALYAEMGNEDARVRYEAAHAAGEIAEPAAVPRLIPLLADRDIEVRLAAIWALGQVGGKQAKEALRTLRKSADERTRAAAEDALSEISIGDESISL